MKLTENDTVIKHAIAFEDHHKVDILLIAENGSRAWGYATETSDYDVKFLFRHSEGAYKKFWEPTDHYLYKPDEMHDYTGWDVKKALGLLWKGNAQIHELVNSPIIYEDSFDARLFKSFANDVLNENLKSVAYHYYGLAYKTYKERIANVGEPTLKKYFYVMRPLLHVETMAETQMLPELTFNDTLKQAYKLGKLPEDVKDTMYELLALKREGNLTKADKLRLDHVDKFCEERLSFWKDKLPTAFPELHQRFTNTESFNRIYQTLVFDRGRSD